MSNTKLFADVATVGKAWRLGRRALPYDIRIAFAELLHVMKPYTLPRPGASVAHAVSDSRPEVFGVLNRLAVLATPCPRFPLPSADVVLDPLLELVASLRGSVGDELLDDSIAVEVVPDACARPAAAALRVHTGMTKAEMERMVEDDEFLTMAYACLDDDYDDDELNNVASVRLRCDHPNLSPTPDN